MHVHAVHVRSCHMRRILSDLPVAVVDIDLIRAGAFTILDLRICIFALLCQLYPMFKRADAFFMRRLANKQLHMHTTIIYMP